MLCIYTSIPLSPLLLVHLHLHPPFLRPLGHVVFLGSFNGTVAQTVRPRPWLIFIFRINEDRPYQRVTQRLSLDSNMFLTCSTPLQVGHYHLHLHTLSLSFSLSHFPLHYRCTLRSFLFSLLIFFFFFFFYICVILSYDALQENYEICLNGTCSFAKYS